MAVHQYYLDQDVPEADRKSPPPTRIVAYGQAGQGGPFGAQKPCGVGNRVVDGFQTWGCLQFMTDEGINTPRKPTPVEMNLPEPFPAFTTKQISVLCPGHKST